MKPGMLKNVTLIETEKDGKATWRLVGPTGLPLESFAAFADSLLRKHPFNTRASYSRHLAEFFDYLFEASTLLQDYRLEQRPTRAFLQEVIEAYDDYLVFGSAAGNRLAVLVDSSKPSPRVSPTTSAVMHAPVRKFLLLSEQLRQEMDDLTHHGLRLDMVDPQPLLTDLNDVKLLVPGQRQAMQATSMIAGVISGGPKFLRSATLPTISPQVPYRDTRAFPFDAIGDFIDALPTFRDKTLYSFLAASGCRLHEALQLLNEDIDVDSGTVALRSPRLRTSHPSYLSLIPAERDRLAWKGRTTESTLLIEPFASLFFANLEQYLRIEYTPHGLHRFVFQFLRKGRQGRPYFLSTATSRLETFKRAATAVGLQDVVHGPHSLRHAYGTYLLNYFPRSNGDYGLPIALVQQLMGHVNVKSTLKYARHDQDLMQLELQHANTMVFNGATPKSLVQLKFEALDAQIRKLRREMSI